MHPKEIVPEGLTKYIRLMAAKLRFRGSYIGSPYIARGAVVGRGSSIARGVELGAGVKIGDCSYVNFGAIIGAGEIGRFCSIGPYAVIGMPEHPISYLSTSPRLYGESNVFDLPSTWEEFPFPPVIGSDVWIGASAFIRQGVRIGHGAIIGAGSVVIRDVQAYEIAGGVPAKRIRSRFEPQIVDRLLASRWWECPLEQLRTHADRFQSPPHKWRTCSTSDSEAVFS